MLKDPAVHVRIWWIMKLKAHIKQSCTKPNIIYDNNAHIIDRWLFMMRRRSSAKKKQILQERKAVCCRRHSYSKSDIYWFNETHTHTHTHNARAYTRTDARTNHLLCIACRPRQSRFIFWDDNGSCLMIIRRPVFIFSELQKSRSAIIVAVWFLARRRICGVLVRSGRGTAPNTV